MPWGEIERESVPCLPACLPACRLPPACLPARLPLPCLAWGFPALLISHPRCLARATCAAQVPFQTSRWLQYKYWIPFRQSIPQLFILEIRASPETKCLPRGVLSVLLVSCHSRRADCRPPAAFFSSMPSAARNIVIEVCSSLFLCCFLLAVSSSLLLPLLSGSCSLSIRFASSCLPSPCLVLRFVSLSSLPLRLSSWRLSSRSIPCPYLPVCATVVLLLLVLPSVTLGPLSFPVLAALSGRSLRLLVSPVLVLSFFSCACSCSLPVQHAVFVVCVPVVLLPSSIALLVLPFLRFAPAAAAAFLVSLLPMSGLP